MQVITVIGTWLNNWIIDFYKLMHPISFLCFALTLAIVMTANNSDRLNDEGKFYLETLRTRAFVNSMIANLMIFTINLFINLSIDVRRRVFNYAGPIFFTTEQIKL